MSDVSQPHSNVLLALHRGTPRDLRTLQIKLTYVGNQHKPLPSIVITTFYHLVRMEWFFPLRSSHLHYTNDEVALWHFTVTPEEILRVVTVLGSLPVLQNPNELNVPCLSVMFVLYDSRLGDMATEVVLSRPDAEVLVDALYGALEASNGVGRTVIALHKQQLFA